MVLNGESLKAQTYVPHGTSLGTLRERMVRSFLRDETPDRFRVETGLIRDHRRDRTSRQCDLLVHDQWTTTPLYRYGDFVIVDSNMARAVVEVKSDLDKAGVEGVLDVNASVTGLFGRGQGAYVPTFGYGLTGATIETLAEHLMAAPAADRVAREGLGVLPAHLNWPVCIAVQNRNIIGIRPRGNITGDNMPVYFCLADLAKPVPGQTAAVNGFETGLFISWYGAWLNKRDDVLCTRSVYQWFDQLPLLPDGKIYVSSEGTVSHGNIALC